MEREALNVLDIPSTAISMKSRIRAQKATGNRFENSLIC
jgi:hypothetical protein